MPWMLVRVHRERMLGCFESTQQECDSGAIHEARLTRAVAGNDKAKT